MTKDSWDFSPPKSAEGLGDRDVRIQVSPALKGKNIALLICGSIAAYRSPDLIRSLRRAGAEVRCFVSSSAQQFVTLPALEWTSLHPPVSCLSADAEHLEGPMDFDAFIVAPASYNTVSKAALGIADCVLSTVIAAAIGKLEQQQTPLIFIPCMNGLMHNSILVENMKKLNDLGVTFMKPRQEDGKNKLPEVDEIQKFVISRLN